MVTRRFLVLSALAATTLTAAGQPALALATKGDAYVAPDGRQVFVSRVGDVSLVIESGKSVIYVDPVGKLDAFEGFPAPTLILITHHHGDHFDYKTLSGLIDPNAGKVKLITPTDIGRQLIRNVQKANQSLANGHSYSDGDLSVKAVPAYNIREDRQFYHPKGRDNGYLIVTGGLHIYVSGHTGLIPEMSDLGPVDIAFLSLEPKTAMDQDEVARALMILKPAWAYIQQADPDQVQAIADTVSAEGLKTSIVVPGSQS